LEGVVTMTEVANDSVDLIADWTVRADDLEFVSQAQARTRLGLVVLLKFFEVHARFPNNGDEFPAGAIEFVATQAGLDESSLDGYSWEGRTVERHRALVRGFLGFRECTTTDAEELIVWLIANVAGEERSLSRVRFALVVRCRAERIELPSSGRLDRMVRAALSRAEDAAVARVAGRLPVSVRSSVETLVGEGLDESSAELSTWSWLKASPGNVSLETMLVEIEKLRRVREVDLPTGLFDEIPLGLVSEWRRVAGVESPSHLLRRSEESRLVLVATLLRARERELTDTLVDLFIATVHRINARADRRVTKELTEAFKRVTGKENLLFKIATAAVDAPDDAVRDVIFPAVKGGEVTLRELVYEFKANGPLYAQTVRATLRASYTNHYRKGLIELLDVLEFDSNNSMHRPVIDALSVVSEFKDSRVRFFPDDLDVPVHKGIVGNWATLVFNDDLPQRRVVRTVYEICTFQALREQLRCKEVWVHGADRWRNPDDDLPADFDDRRLDYYTALRQPLDPSEFIDRLREEMETELAALDGEIDRLDWVDIADRGKRGPIRLSPLDAVPEPASLRALKAEVGRRWGTVPMIDMLKEAVLRSGCLDKVTSVASRDGIAPDVLVERILLVIYAYGTNTGIAAIAGGEHGHSENDLRYVRRRYLTNDVAQAVAVEIANATFAARDPEVWGAGSSAVASDSTHFRAYDQNIFTEWHARYGGRGVLIYWHVERKSMAIHSQLISCSASEVAAMIEGAIRHSTDMAVEGNYVDSHGQTEIGFGITRLLGFDLLPRIKRINTVKLYRPGPKRVGDYSNIADAMSRPIQWGQIAEQYDQMIRYATAIRTGTASTEAILRRFMRTNAQHPTYQAMIETGRAQKTVFVARYLRDRQLQRSVNDGLNVVESWNRGNSVFFYGKGGDIASNRRDEQELSVLCLRILQTSLVYVNTLMIQDTLIDPAWSQRFTSADRRGLTPLFWSHVAPYGEVRLNMARRLELS
jgi:TnpA family transposase